MHIRRCTHVYGSRNLLPRRVGGSASGWLRDRSCSSRNGTTLLVGPQCVEKCCFPSYLKQYSAVECLVILSLGPRVEPNWIGRFIAGHLRHQIPLHWLLPLLTSQSARSLARSFARSSTRQTTSHNQIRRNDKQDNHQKEGLL